MISGIFENCVGSKDIEATLKYWNEFGYREVKKGEFSAEQAKLLYGHASDLISLRLQNGNSSDHGLVRLMWWKEPRNEGLGDTLPVVEGSRWFASLTQDIYAIADAFADDKANGGDWIYTEPVRGIEFVGNVGTGLYNRFVGVREMFVIGKETRQAFFQRYNYNRPGYGTINANSGLLVSEGTHSSFITSDHSLTSFYTEVFGLVPSENNPKLSGYKNAATRQIMMLDEGQEFYLSVFASPKTNVGVFQVYSPLYPTSDRREYAQPGSLGISLFTYQVEDIEAFHQRVIASNATDVTPIVPNEFGEPSFGLVAPDGMYWVIVG
ncbi:VOC family protein [Nostoc sp. CCY 9925]|uniref:VOC family protein n=1 Tax=Nostoc sp. CCY 9925 TaxID=3103865 RepID=UPI0039C75C5F